MNYNTLAHTINLVYIFGMVTFIFKNILFIGKLGSATKEMILRSYHVYDNTNHHDPGTFSAKSLDLINTIDESVYKTFINPVGIRLTTPIADLQKVQHSSS